MKIASLLLICAITACNFSNHDSVATTDSNNSVVKSGDTTKSRAPVLTVPDTLVNAHFLPGANSLTVQGEMQGIDKPVTVLFPAKKDQLLLALLVVQDTIANIRINQVIMPNGQADGPFGRELNKKITSDGTCKIILAENKMQGEEWKGKFTLTLKLE